MGSFSYSRFPGLAAKAAGFCALTVAVASVFALASHPELPPIEPAASIAYVAPYAQLEEDVARARSVVLDRRQEARGVTQPLVAGYSASDDALADAMIDIALRAVEIDGRLEAEASAALEAFGRYQRSNSREERVAALAGVDAALREIVEAAARYRRRAPAARPL